MKNLIVYYSFTQNNEKLARYLAAKLHCDSVRIETLKPRNGLSIFLDIIFYRKPALKLLNRSLQVYDHVIFMAPIWAGRLASPLRSLLIQERSIAGKYSFISVCGGEEGQKERVEKELVSLLGKKPAGHIELSVHNLLASRGRGAGTVTGYRLGLDELINFEPQLKNFIAQNSLVDLERV